MTNNCSTCSNCVADAYCTMQKDMDKAKYQQCDGFTIAPKVVSKITTEKSAREERMEKKLDLGTEWAKFIATGGHYSCRTRSHIIGHINTTSK